jgi:FkbM family methyltransferase
MTSESPGGSRYTPPSFASRAVYALLLKVRPAQLAALLKVLLRIRRRYVTTLAGHTHWVDPVSVFGHTLLAYGIYEPSLTRIVQGLLRTGDVFLDVGAHEGYFSILASSLVGISGTVHAIEPQRRLSSVLHHVVELNCVQCITMHSTALTDHNGTVELFLRPDPGASSIFPHWRLGTKREVVPTLTLDEFFRRNSLNHVRLMKVDCEGAENLVVNGGGDCLARQAIDFLALEYHPWICGSANCDLIHKRLLSYGYSASRVDGNLIYYRPGLERELGSIGATTPVRDLRP